MRPIPTCLLSGDGPERVSHGHDPDRFVQIGSLTKVLTGTALMRLAEAKTLELADPVERWLPVPPGTGITLLHLAEHTSGLPRLPPGLSGRDPYASFDDAALRALCGRLKALTVREPGTEEEYSNFGYAVLGAALVAATGQPYERVVREQVLNPLGIDAMAVQPPADRRLCATGLFGRERKPWTMQGAILPAGGMWATPRAAARLLTGLLVERELGAPAPSWQHSGTVTWHNGATRDASVFAGALPDGRWVLVHQLGGSPDATDAVGVRHLIPPKAA
ncbi:serine hydrolase domain-containing protein [Streptomyces zagrosensis]|uniref:D-alanyl-D-alanine-carboxypeptidase/D-alanyl-D-alanine-endopeptidase n=1 Tax=Streptomyces zagrosensis TaxID=1042984 RepID=A0A7W9V045_9ACTN|nr:serine hydrolase domain-containing protein [Streptomyces zagrosensis]MBB5937743.1 D-alanyl-D-alanine-carboxypeptidase/D-alanyl-D-alanine-endopeptidase [Streptomyces zagrosensis]